MASLPGPAGVPHEPVEFAESIWRAPLLPAALAFTVGIVLDRFAGVPFGFSILLGMSSLLGFLIVRLGGPPRLGALYLLLAGISFGAVYHHYRHKLYPADDIARFATEDPLPVRLRGILEEEPRRLPGKQPDQARSPREMLRSQPSLPTATTIVRVTHLIENQPEQIVSGRIRLIVTGKEQPLLADFHPGDQVEVRGRMVRLASRKNPGEFDLAAYWHDRGVHALVHVRQGDAGVKRLSDGWVWSISGWLGRVRGAAHDLLEGSLKNEISTALARALLLGEGAPLTHDDWGMFVRTGVIHVLAISGQHLVVVAWFLWIAAQLFGVRQRHAAMVVPLVLVTYALVTGGRPPAIRAAVGASAVCVGLVIGRPAMPANLFALAWLVVGIWRPADYFEAGCQLSFLAVAILCWGASWVLMREEDPLAEVVERSRPVLVQGLRWVGQKIFESYLVCFIVWVGITPLAAFHTGMIAPAALLLGPPLTFLTSIALLAGFVVLVLAPVSSWAAAVPAWVVHQSLSSCQWLVNLAERWPAHRWVGELPVWWVVVFYVALLAVLTHSTLRNRWRWVAPGGLGWLCLGLVMSAEPTRADELRCTFLAVGHGSAIVLELPDGRTILYDAGSMRGPDVTARIIAPFLWSRRIQRIDDVIVSHADLDHFNGLVDLADRFSIGRVLTSETFTHKDNRAVDVTLAEFRRRQIQHKVIRAGDRLVANSVTFNILHPPANYTAGNENARSLVVEVRHCERSILLTGDLEGVGLDHLLQTRPRKMDILQAPHHGSARLDIEGLIRWCKPALVVSCQGARRGMQHAEARYARDHVEFWTTHAQGAITVRSSAAGLQVEGYHDGKRWSAGGQQGR